MVKSQPFTTQAQVFMTQKKKYLENIVGKGDNAGKQHFLLFQQCSLPYQRQIKTFEKHLICGLQGLKIWTSPTFRR